MDNEMSEFIPESADKQSDQLPIPHDPTAQDEQLIADLHQMYQRDKRSLMKVWQRLGLENEQLITIDQQKSMEETPSRLLQLDSAKRLNPERNHDMHQTRKHSLARPLSLLAAACITALIVGGMLLISNLARQHQLPHTNVSSSSSPTPSALPPSLYTSDGTTVYRLNSRTHQAIWHQPLQVVSKIVPGGNMVYILQSTQSGGKTNAVVALDARNGKILWIYSLPTSNGIGQATDLAFAQNRLYVGWLIPAGTNAAATNGQIYILNPSTGKQQAVYSGSAIDSLVAGEGVIAVSGNHGLVVYLATNGKPVWHVTYSDSVESPVEQMSIVNGQIYALVSTNNLIAGVGKDYIVSYNINSGQQTWQSPIFPGSSLGSFTVNGQSIYFATFVIDGMAKGQPQSGSVYAYNTTSNKQLWHTTINGGGQGPLIIDNGILYIGADNGSDLLAHLIALETATGAQKWQVTLTGNFLDSLVVNNSVAYASSTNNPQKPSVPDQIEALDAGSGQFIWKDAEHGTTIVVTE